jgi:nucleotide-binding universal stress UspA family protein
MATVFARPLLATEHGEFDDGAETLAFALARHCQLPLAGILPMVSNPEFEAVAPQLAAKADADAAAKRQSLATRARVEGVAFELQLRRGSEPYVEIVEEARQRASDLIVIRRRGKRGFLANLLVGEMVSKVVAHAPCSVLIAPRGARMWSKRVLVGIDPQTPDDPLLARAAALAADCGLPLRVLCVATHEAARAPAEQALAAALQHARQFGASVDGEVRVGRVYQELIQAAKACAADLLVIARHRGDKLERAWIGGVAQKVIGLTECPVLVHVNNPRTPAP